MNVSVTGYRDCLPEFIRVDSGHESGLSVHGVGQFFIRHVPAETNSSASKM